jgi:hypothetical protein
MSFSSSRLNRETKINKQQIIMTLTILISDARHADGLQAYSCKGVKEVVKVYALIPPEGCWSEHPHHPAQESRRGRILWMRDEARFPVIHCKLTETALKVDCKKEGGLGAWQMLALEKLIPMGPRDCMQTATSGRIVLFDRAILLGVNGTAMDINEEKINMHIDCGCPRRGRRGQHERAHVQSWANLDRTPKDLYTTLFRDLSATPFTQI